MQGRYDEIRGLGAEALVVAFEPAERLPRYREWHGWRFPVVSDPTLAGYRAFGLGSAGWTRLLRPKVALRYTALMARGYLPTWSGADVRQLGGDFVIDAGHRLVYAHRSADPADRPSAGDLVTALRASAARPGEGGR